MSFAGIDVGNSEATAYGKNGQGAFSLTVFRPGKVVAQRNGGALNEFDTPRAAYDWYRAAHDITQDHASWNICYFLEDHLTE